MLWSMLLGGSEGFFHIYNCNNTVEIFMHFYRKRVDLAVLHIMTELIFIAVDGALHKAAGKEL